MVYFPSFFLSQLVKLCSNMVDAGKAYIITNKQFVGGVRDLSQQCKKDEMISVRNENLEIVRVYETLTRLSTI